jgi:hypothetical protein
MIKLNDNLLKILFKEKLKNTISIINELKCDLDSSPPFNSDESKKWTNRVNSAHKEIDNLIKE